MGLEKRTSAAKAVERANVYGTAEAVPFVWSFSSPEERTSGLKRVCENLKGNRRSLHYAPPYFLSSLLALVKFMRLSLLKAAQAVVSSAVWQEIRVRQFCLSIVFRVSKGCPRNCRSLGFARDDKGDGNGSIKSGR